jgi:hypothetical protein
VDGRRVVEDGRALAFDLADALGRLQDAQRRAEERFRGLDYADRRHDEASPLTYARG